MRLKPVHIFSLLILLFLVFTAHLYTNPVKQSGTTGSYIEAAEGRLVWQKYNCQSCHQLYGLGGYLGPDLTHIVAQPGKDETYLKGIIQAGNARMPGYTLSPEEMQQVIAFFKMTNASGTADPSRFRILPDGMITPNE